MAVIKIANSKGLDAEVGAQSVLKPMKVRWIGPDNRQVSTARVMKGTLSHDMGALESKAGGKDKIAQLLVESDPEVDVEQFGVMLKETKRVFVDPDGKIVHRVQQFEVVKNADGTERERRPKKVLPPNTNIETPLKWSGRMMKKSEVYNKFVFAGKRQIVHVNGLTYDFLFKMAEELEKTQSLMLLGAGPRGNQPLVLQRGGQPYRGFLEGRTQKDKYCLILHLSNMELKPAAEQEK
jgi:hypothetical protein